MSEGITFDLNKASEPEIADLLTRCDPCFVPPLSGRVEIGSYAQKIVGKATRFEAWDGTLVGLLAIYCNDDEDRVAYITSISVLPAWWRRGVASGLLERCLEHAREQGFRRIELEVDRANVGAVKLYGKYGFTIDRASKRAVIMRLNVGKERSMSYHRDYNVEMQDASDHPYAYNFDFDVMHPFLVRSFEPFFNKGSMLELGSFKGDFTKRLLSHFDDVTCVEASDVAIEEAKRRLGDSVTFVNSLFETANLPRRYDNIALTHVLEHLDDPVLVLRRINEEWLADGGRLFLVCPNANAPSRQIAVKMGLIAHNAAVTPTEAEHGHRRTYSLDTLEREAVAAGLKVSHRSGIFFKALANFQWDRLLKTDIISSEYLEGCYKLGQQYPDLCSSIFLMCERGDHRTAPDHGTPGIAQDRA
jgi:GNAT superfamily N-acetyltransferase/SAM-dependent methyltransferase